MPISRSYVKRFKADQPCLFNGRVSPFRLPEIGM